MSWWRWPWGRRRDTGEDAVAATRDANKQLRAAHEIARRVERTADAARDIARRTDRFADEIERAWRASGGMP